MGRTRLWTVLCLVLAAVCGLSRADAEALNAPVSASGASGASGAPNIIYFIVDDLGWADLGCFGSEAIKTPNIDRLAAEGMRFTQAYAGCTVCAPSRAVLMTGQHGGHTSLRSNTGGVSIRDEDTTIAEVLKPADYTIGGFGKWGIADVGTPGVPEKQGFDEFFGYYHQIHAHYFYPDYLWHNSTKVELPANAGFYETNPRGTAGAVDVNADGATRQFSQYLIVEQMLRFLRENKDKRFFCYAPWTPPHGGYEIPASDPAWALYKDKDWPEKAKVHAAYVTMVDRQVGQVLDLVKELGLDEKTIIFFCSDNGASDRFEGSLNSSGPLRGQKTQMYEGGLRTPLMARWPGRIKPASVSEHVCYFADIMPTLAELAGATAPSNIDGISIVPTLLGRGEQKPHDYLYWEWVGYNWNNQPLDPRKLGQAIRVGDMKLVRGAATKPWELYDLASDMAEQHDLAKERPEMVKQLEQKIRQVRTEPLPQIEPKMPKGKKYR